MSKLKIFTRSDDPNTTLGWAERIAYGFGNVGNAVVYGMVSLYLTYFYTDVMGLSASIIGTIFLLSRVFAGMTQTSLIYYVEWVLHNDDLYGIIYNVQQVTQIVFLAVAAPRPK